MRILLIEDHPIVRAACRRLLEVIGGIEIMDAATAADGFGLADQLSPDIIVLDLNLPDGSGLSLLRRLVAHAPDRKIVVLSMYEDPAFAAAALEAGARGYMTKSDDAEVLVQAIDKVAAGGVFLTPGMAEKLALTVAGDHSPPEFSVRESEVLELLGCGRTLAEVADELKISYRTSAHIAAQIRLKLGLGSTAALIRWAVDYSRLPMPQRRA